VVASFLFEYFRSHCVCINKTTFTCFSLLF
jgi:hypothetical protein